MSVDAEKQWQVLYAALDGLLSAHGRSSAYGDADYWLVDDDWGGQRMKVVVSAIAFLTPDLTREIQQLLQKRHPDWTVLCSLELHHRGERLGQVPAEGITVRPGEVFEDWDRRKLGEMLGPAFSNHWPA